MINVGGGLNILGDGFLTAQLTGNQSFGAAIGSDYDEKSTAAINIGGKVNITASTVNNGAGIGSGNNSTPISTISIGGNAKVNASATQGEGIGGTVTYGKGTTVTTNNTDITDDQKKDNVTADSIKAPAMNFAEITVDLKDFTNSTATYQKLNKTDGYSLNTTANVPEINYTVADYADQFTLMGIKSADGITVDAKTGVVTLTQDNLIDDPKAGETKVELTDINGNYTLALASEVPQALDTATTPSAIKGTNFTIDKDGIYQFAKGFTGTVNIAKDAKNVKLIGAGSTLSKVYIDASAVTDANLWIKDLNISANGKYNLIKFGTGTNNYLTVEGTNTLENTYADSDFNEAVINVGGGLNILGNGSLNAKLTGNESYGAAIGSDLEENLFESNINIGGNVTVNATGGYGAGIGTGGSGNIGAISIGGKATVNAKATEGEGIGAGKGAVDVMPTYGKNTTVKNKNDDITADDKQDNVDADNLTAQTDPFAALCSWTELKDGASSYKQTMKTAGYVVSDDAKSLSFGAAEESTLFTLSGIKSIDGITIEDNVVTLTDANLNQETVSFNVPEGSEEYSLNLAEDVDVASTVDGYFSAVENNQSVYKSGSAVAGYQLSSDGNTVSYVAAQTATDLFTISGLTDTVGITVSNDNELSFDASVFTITDDIHVTGLKAGTNYNVDGTTYTWSDIDGNTVDVEFNLWTQIEENKFAFNDAVTVAGISADDVTALTDKIKVVDGVLNFVDATVANNFSVHVNMPTVRRK